MSLINDALRKARKAQPVGAATSTADGPQMQPVETGVHVRDGSIFTLPFIIAVVLVLACVLFWAWYHAGRVDLVVRGNSPVAKVVPTAPISEPVPVPKPVVAPGVPAVAITAAPVPATPVAPVPVTPLIPTTPATVERANSTLPASVAALPLPQPAPTTYQLQGIFYRPNRPAAVINGELVYVGSRVEDGRVVAIDDESATVVTLAGQTNLLVLVR